MSDYNKPQIQYLAINLIEPNSWNPYEMDKVTFNALLENIKEQGFDDPLTVIKLDNGKYRVIDGEHRLQGASALGMKEVPCIVKEKLDEDTQKLQTIRRNHIKGDINKKKFSRLVKEYCDRNKLDHETVAAKMAFKNSKEFLKYIIDKKKKDKELLGIETKEDKLISERLVKKLVEDILRKNVDNLENGYLQFAYKGKEFVSIQMSKETCDALNRTIKYVQENGVSLDGFLRKSLVAELV